MSTEKQERQYQAYQALKDLSDLAADTMKQIAYGQMESIDWDDTCRLHRDAFARWIEFADGQRGRDGPESIPSTGLRRAAPVRGN